MTLLEVVVSIALDGVILAGLLASLVAAAHSAGQSWHLFERIETVCRVEQLADHAADRAAAAGWARIDAHPASLSFSIDADGDGRIDGRSSEFIGFEIGNDRLIHRIGRQRVAVAAVTDDVIRYRSRAGQAVPALAEVSLEGGPLLLALPTRSGAPHWQAGGRLRTEPRRPRSSRVRGARRQT